jgi:hypothetical protein
MTGHAQSGRQDSAHIAAAQARSLILTDQTGTNILVHQMERKKEPYRYRAL